MTIQTKSVFYYGHTIDETNTFLDFSEGAGQLDASLNIGEYTLEQFIIEVARAINAVGGQIYSVSVNRITRKITILAPGNFEILTTTGTRSGTSVFTLLGFSGADKTGSNSYTGDSASGSAYRPQRVLTDYLAPELNREDVSAKVNESGDGNVIEVFSFGQRRFVEFMIEYITNLPQPRGATIDENLTGVQDAVSFMEYVTTKASVEFMSDRNDPSTYINILLEKTKSNSKGVGFEILKMFKAGVEGYYKIDLLIFREME